ncbi:MAG: GTP cyclohydrolase I [Crenarchaeota archaeon]|nr:GTP cyclohydrolase I [Thermoproteota archaeon]
MSREELVDKIAMHVREILRLVGEDPDRPDLRETPTRVARALLELTEGLRREPPHIKFFRAGKKIESYVIVENIEFFSLCEHHLLPVIGYVSVAYKPEHDEVPGLSKVVRLVQWYSRRLILQERFTQELAWVLLEKLKASSVYCKVLGIHLCTMLRGVRSRTSRLLTEAWAGDITRDELVMLRKLVKCRSLKI